MDCHVCLAWRMKLLILSLSSIICEIAVSREFPEQITVKREATFMISCKMWYCSFQWNVCEKSKMLFLTNEPVKKAEINIFVRLCMVPFFPCDHQVVWSPCSLSCHFGLHGESANYWGVGCQQFCTLPRFCFCIKFKIVAQTTWQSKHSTITQKNRCVNSLIFCWLAKQPGLRVRPGHNI